MPVMNHCSTQPQRARAWHAALCLLLAVLFLYNPFFTVHDVSGVLQVRHPLSYRATVASSELRRSTIDPAKPLIPATGVLAAQTFLAAPPPPQRAPAFPIYLQDDFVAGPQQVVFESIRFRPPPAV
jgi:hypothetical protein